MILLSLDGFGFCASIALMCFALWIRLWSRVDTTALSADWSLLLIAAAGMSFSFYFAGLSSYERPVFIIVGVLFYLCALLLWFIGARQYTKVRK